ncbi:MAG: acyl-CoA thioester hydrolase/BAAT C-terminal domain-containing protein [Bacteroidales bacterium]
MKYTLTTLIILSLTVSILGQTKSAKDFGFHHLQFNYKSDKVDILIKSKKGEENKKKPLFFFCQGSLPKPLIKYDGQIVYGVFPFNSDSLAKNYHLVIVGKPYIPLISDVKTLGNNFNCIDSITGVFPEKYSERNLLEYYVDRNIQIIKFLQKQKWVSNKQLVVAGHSEGSTVAAKMASTSPMVTHLIYSGGNPMGRIMSIIQQSRANETDTDSTRYAEDEIKYWQSVVANKTSMDASQGDTHKATYQFSQPPIEYLEKLKIPVLICYGTKDWSAPYNDFLRVDVIRKKKKNFQFNPYIGTEHNYFPLSADNKPNYEIFNWDKVASDWLKWLYLHSAETI